MEKSEKLLKDYSDLEKGAYLGAISSIATADRSASEEELQYIQALADSAELSPEQKEAVNRAATELSGDELKRCLDILKTSDLRFSLITDLIAFAETDQNYTEEEKANVEKIAQYLNINQQQFSLLDQFVKKASQTEAQPEEMSEQGFLGSLGLGDKLKNSGININSLTKGLLGVAGPIVLAGLLRRGMGGGMSRGFGGMGNEMGGLGGGGGLGSIISMLSGGRGMRSTGGLFGRMFGF